LRNLWAGIFRLLGAALALASCIPMLAMLPAGFATILALLGLGASPLLALAAPLAPFAPSLLILSVAIFVFGNLRCGWQPAGLAAIGGLLVYLSMYVFVTPMAREAMTGMQGMILAQTPRSGMLGLTNAPMFYIGLLLMIASFGLVLWRRRQKICLPFSPLAMFRPTRQK
jgi:LPXTG-motif cell wall-anchored protein